MRCNPTAIERGEPIWHTRSTVPISIPSSSDAVATTARNSPFLSFCSASRRKRAGEAAVVRQHGVGAETLAQVVGHALRQAPRVDEDQGSAVRADQLGDAVVDLVPHLVGGHRAELVARHLDGQIHVAPVPHVDHAGAVAQESRDVLDRLHRRGKADALRRGAAVLIVPAGRDAPASTPGASRAYRRRRRGSRPRSAVRTRLSISRGFAAVSRM